MNKTGIEWVRNPDGSQGYTWNPITGCLNHVNGLCKGGGFPCYAYRLANGRLKQRYLANENIPPAVPATNLTSPIYSSVAQVDPFYPRFWEERLTEPRSYSIRKGIFVCDMGELFGDWIPDKWTQAVMRMIQERYEHRFYLLTKQPQNLIKFSPFLDNCWVGVTATNYDMFVDACGYLCSIKAKGGAKVTFVSLEPLLSWDDTDQFCQFWLQHGGIDWLIIGACTGSLPEMVSLCDRYPFGDLAVMRYGNKFTAQPKIEWVQEIVEAADKAGVKVFLKDNLWPLLTGHPEFWEDIPQGNHPNYESIAELRQEMPTDGV